MQDSRDPHTRAVAHTDGSRILSVADAVTHIDDHYAAHIDGITTHPMVSDRHLRRLLASGALPCTRTPRGELGITVSDLDAIWDTGGGRP